MKLWLAILTAVGTFIGGIAAAKSSFWAAPQHPTVSLETTLINPCPPVLPHSEETANPARRPSQTPRPPAKAPPAVADAGWPFAERPAEKTRPLPLRPPNRVKAVPPVYPAEAQERGIQGVVIVLVTIAPSGKVTDVSYLGGDREPSLVQAALDAVRQWEYTPYTLPPGQGPVKMSVTVSFKLVA